MEWALASRLVMNKGGLKERRLGGAAQERSSIFHGFNLLWVLCLSSVGTGWSHLWILDLKQERLSSTINKCSGWNLIRDTHHNVSQLVRVLQINSNE